MPDYETSVKKEIEKQIYSEYTVDTRAPVKFKESEREETNFYLMTIEDMIKHKVVGKVRKCPIFGEVFEQKQEGGF